MHDSANHNKLPKDYSSIDFIADWLQEVAQGDGDGSSDSDAPAAENTAAAAHPVGKDRRRKYWNSEDGKKVRLDGRFHCLQHAGHVYSKNAVVNGVSKRNDLRRLCRYCGERALYFCDVCNVPLCVGDCCKKFHTERVLPKLK